MMDLMRYNNSSYINYYNAVVLELIFYLPQYKNDAIENCPIVYCALGKCRDGITVKQLIESCYSIGVITDGPKDRYIWYMLYCKYTHHYNNYIQEMQLLSGIRQG